MKEQIGAVFVLALCLGVFAGGLAMWVDAPPTRPGPAIVTPEAAPDNELERGLCAMIDRPQGLSLPIVEQGARSGRVHYTLAALMEQYVAAPGDGARGQVVTECRRLELLP